MNSFPFSRDPLPLVIPEIAVRPSGEIRISEIVAVGSVEFVAQSDVIEMVRGRS